MHFPLHPETPAEGRSMADLYAGRNADPEAMYRRMKGLMDAEGLLYGRRTHTYNSRLAQELGKWADTQAGGAALHDALYRAYFVDARNIGDPGVLCELVGSVGLPAEEARAVLSERRFKDAVDQDWAKSHALRRHRGPDLRRRPLRCRRRPALRSPRTASRQGGRPARRFGSGGLSARLRLAGGEGGADAQQRKCGEAFERPAVVAGPVMQHA